MVKYPTTGRGRQDVEMKRSGPLSRLGIQLSVADVQGWRQPRCSSATGTVGRLICSGECQLHQLVVKRFLQRLAVCVVGLRGMGPDLFATEVLGGRLGSRPAKTNLVAVDEPISAVGCLPHLVVVSATRP